MKHVEVEAVEDRSRAEGGHAVILLRGVERLPGQVRFRLRPADADAVPSEVATALAGDLSPIAVEATNDGLALSIGPQLTELQGLVPGTQMVIALPDAGVQGEFAWPAVAPSSRPRRRNIMIRRRAGDPFPGTVADPRHVPAVVQDAAGEPPVDAVDQGRGAVGPAAPGVAAEPARSPAPARRPIVVTSAVPRRPPAAETAGPAPVGGAAPTAAVAVAPSLSVDQAAAIAEPAAKPAPPQVQPSANPVPSHGTAGTSLPTARATLPSRVEPVLRPATPRLPRLPRLPLTLGGRKISAASAAAMAVAVLVGGQIVALRALDLSITRRSQPAAVPTPTAVPATFAPGQQRSIYEIIAAGPRSPRGLAADGVSPAKALQTAHALLHGPESNRDPEEAIYWLKRYLAGTSGADHARIALTQLGTAYVQPIRGKRDFSSARLAWELAGALGDPVAMCFLGAIHEHGLGVAPARQLATIWYDRAAAVGRSCASGSLGLGSEGR